MSNPSFETHKTQQHSPLSIIVLISGQGANLQAFIDAQKNGLPIDIQLVISNSPDAYGLQRAKQHQIPTAVINHRDFNTREEFEVALQQRIDAVNPQLIVLAGFMRILGKAFVERYYGRLINLHPSLLPKYPGFAPHRRVLANGETQHGCSIHFVNAELDAGPIIAQAQCEVKPNDTETSLQQRVKQLEHRLYPLVLTYFVQQRIRLSEDNTVFLDENALGSTGKLITFTP